MKNISKIADEIFKAPTEEDLLQRATEGFIKNPDGTYDSNENVRVGLNLVKNGKLIIKFKKVNGDFNCENYGAFAEPGLKTLEGCPQIVTGNFCQHNTIKTLRGAPIHVGRHFDCSSNKLRSLRDGPGFVGGNYHCDGNMLTNLEGSPEEVRSFICHSNSLTSLKGGPIKVNGMFHCSSNKLISLKGCPKIVYGDFYCEANSKTFTEKEVRAVCKVEGRVNV